MPAHPDPVLVVGAGPTGLVLASELARHGVDCRVVDEEAERRSAPRAITVHARTLEVLDDMGVVDDMLAAGQRVRGVHVYATPLGGDARRVGYLDLSALESPYPFMLGIQQPDTERILEQLLERRGVRVERRVRFVALSPEDEAVTAELVHLDGGRSERTRFSYVVGCDGVHSTVRDVLEVPFVGKRYQQGMGLIDMRVDWTRSHDEAQVFFGPAGDAEFHPMPGEQRWRLAVSLFPEPPGHTREEPTLRRFQTMAAERGARDAVLVDPTWMSDFNFHLRIVSRYRVGRAFLAGDAAHVHSPVGAQGMNLGMQDAYNLAWKLALVVRGVGQPAILDSYEAERRPIADRVLRNTNIANLIVTRRGSVGRALRARVLRVVSRSDLATRRIASIFSGIGLRYARSPLVREDFARLHLRRRAPRPGDRAPPLDVLRGTRHVALLFHDERASDESRIELARMAAAIEREHGEHVAAYVVAATGPYGACANALYLIRPDGHVGYRLTPIDTALLDRHLRRVLR